MAIEVFDGNGQLSVEYKKVELSENTHFKLSETWNVKVNRFLGAGNTTDIYSVTKIGEEVEYALRLPKSDFHYIYSTNQLYPILEHYKIKIPKRHTTIDSNFILSEVVEIAFDMKTFFIETIESNDKRIVEEAREALLNFAKDTAMFESIGDFNGTQLVYSKEDKAWLLLDWMNSYELFNPYRNQFLITKENISNLANSRSMSEKALSLLDELRSVIKEERLTLEERDERFFNSLSSLSSDKFKEAISFRWSTRIFKDKFKEEYLIKKINTIDNLELSNKDFKEIKRFFKFYDRESEPLLTLQLKLSKTKKDFVKTILEDNTLFSFAKRDILETTKHHFIELGGTLEELSEIKKLLDKDLSTCRESMKLFF